MARILLVEDEDAVARVMVYSLREAGHVATVAPTGHAALLAARVCPDLILLDLGLPDISGDEVLRRLKRQSDTAQIPVVIVSGEPDAAALVGRAGATGPAAILQKPILGSELRAVVDIVLDACRAGAEGGAGPARRGTDARDRQQSELLYRLISAGSGPLVRQVCHRIGADRARGALAGAVEASSWPEIIRRAKQEGLLKEAEGRSLIERATCRPPEPIV